MEALLAAALLQLSADSQLRIAATSQTVKSNAKVGPFGVEAVEEAEIERELAHSARGHSMEDSMA